MDAKKCSTKVSHIEYKETGKCRFRCRENKSFILVLEIIGIRFKVISLNSVMFYQICCIVWKQISSGNFYGYIYEHFLYSHLCFL